MHSCFIPRHFGFIFLIILPSNIRFASIILNCMRFASSFRILLSFSSPIDGQVYAILDALSVFVGGNRINGLAEFSLRVAGAITDRGSIFLLRKKRADSRVSNVGSFPVYVRVLVVPGLNPARRVLVRSLYL